MAPVNLKYIVSFTSQDDNHKANNLIKGDGSKKWLSHPKDKSGRAEVVIQLEAPTLLQYLDIGVIWCAFLEVRVGRSDWPQSREFTTLVPTVSLMSPTDCLLRRGTSSSCMFSKNDFSQDLANQPWDRVQLVCRQPFRKDSQFGISFIHVKSQCSLPSPVAEKHDVKECGDGEAVKSSKNVELIKSHFFGNHNTSDSPSKADQLKSRLLRISGSTEQEGVGPFQALSRTAQIVMKASEKADSLSPYRKQISPHRHGRLLSEHVSTKKNDVGIDDEIKTFLPTLSITVADIDQVTVADLRHKFEKSKKRKLTCKEKKIFLQLSQEFFSDLLDGDRENGPQAPGRAASLLAVSSKSKPRSAHNQNSSPCEDRANLSLPNTPEVQNKQRNSESSKVTIFSSSPSSPRSKSSPEVRHSRSAAPNRVLHSQALQTSEPVVTTSKCLSSRPKNVVRPGSETDLTKDGESNEVSTSVRNQRRDIHKANGSSSGLKRKSGHSYRESTIIKANNSGKSPNSLFGISSFDDEPVTSTTSMSEPSSCPRRKIQTLENVNKSFEDLHDTFIVSKSDRPPSNRLPARGMKRKLNQRSLNLLDMFRQEIEENEDGNGGTPSASPPRTHSHSPWLSAAKKKVTTGESKASSSGQSYQFYHSESELERKGDSCSPSTSRSSNKITTKSKSSPSSSEGKMCHTCLSIVPHSAYAAHQRICVTLEAPSTSRQFTSHSRPTSREESGFPYPSEQISDELFIDDDEDFGECPICMQSFPLSSLPVHASECGL